MLLDIVIVVALVIGLVLGWMKGFFLQLAGLAGAVIGFFIACFIYAHFGDSLIPKEATSTTQMLCFLVLWIVMPLLLTLCAKFITGIFKTISLGWLNNVLGGVTGALKMLFFISLALTFLEFIDQKNENPMIDKQTKETSKLYYPVQKFASKVLPSDFLSKVEAAGEIFKPKVETTEGKDTEE